MEKLYRIDKFNNVIVFDEECLLCNRIVRLILRFDKNQIFRFTSFNSNFLKNLGLDDLPKTTVLLIKNDNILKKSNAIFEIIKKLSFPINMMIIFRVLPQSFTDYIYDFIVRNRFIFQTENHCDINIHNNSSRFYL